MLYYVLNNSRGEAIDHVSISKDDQVQPSAAPLPACRNTNFMTSCL